MRFDSKDIMQARNLAELKYNLECLLNTENNWLKGESLTLELAVNKSIVEYNEELCPDKFSIAGALMLMYDLNLLPSPLLKDAINKWKPIIGEVKLQAYNNHPDTTWNDIQNLISVLTEES